MFDLGGTIGGLLFIRLVAPQGLKLMGAREAHAVEGRCFRLVRVSLATALFALLGWLALEASDMSGAANATDVLAAIPTVLLGTSFGHDLFVQALSVFAALVLVTARPQRWRCVAVGLAGLALALQARTATPSPWSIAPACCSTPKDCTSLPRCLARKSAAAAYPGTRRPAEARSRDAEALLKARHVLRRRHRGTACFQGWVLGGGVAGLIGTAYGSVLLLKAALFAALLGIAAINRFRLTPAMERLDTQRARRAFMRTIAAETVIGLMVVLAAGLLSGLEPGMHTRPAATVAGAPLTMS
jgi:putative copper export protein